MEKNRKSVEVRTNQELLLERTNTALLSNEDVMPIVKYANDQEKQSSNSSYGEAVLIHAEKLNLNDPRNCSRQIST